ncbi:hypothetical protein AHAS_Ahas14G0101600 [Arachis hypogaea]
MVHSPNNGNGVIDRQKVKSSGSIWKKRQPEISPAKTAENGNKDLEEESDDVGLKKLLQEKKRKMEFVFGGDSKAAELEFERLSKVKAKLDSMKVKLIDVQNHRAKGAKEPCVIFVPIAKLRGKAVLSSYPAAAFPFSAVVSFTSPAKACPFSLSSLSPSLPSQSSPSSHLADVVVAVSLPLNPPSQKPCNRRHRLSDCSSKRKGCYLCFNMIHLEYGYYPLLGKFCGFVIPSSLSAIDHWSPEVKLLFMEPKNEQPNSSKKAKDLNIEGYPVGGLSIGGHETCIIFPTLKVAFDIGRCPPRAVSQDFLLISHAHMDHIGGLPMYVATRGLYRMKPPTIIVPISVKEDVEKLFEVHRKMDHSELKHNLIGLDVGEEFYLRKDLKVKAFRTYHVISSQGYILYYVRQKLKPEYIGLSGNEIKNLKSSGVEITYTLTEPEIAFTGDTMSDFIVDESNTDVLRARILVIECTFVNNSITVEHAKDYGHTHLSEIIGYAERFKNRAILLIHFSARYTVEEIEEAVTGLPPPLAGRTFALTEGF